MNEAVAPRGRSVDRRDACLLVCLAVLSLMVFHPVFSAGFVLVDDHEILSYGSAARASPQLGDPPNLLQRITIDEVSIGRVRPLYWLGRVSEIAVLGQNPAAWHVLLVGMGVLSAALLYLVLRGIGVDRLSGALASAWLLLAPAHSVWIRLGPQESLGTLLVVLAAFATIRIGWEWVFAISLSAATLAKESFSLVPPGVVAMRLWLDSARHLRDRRSSLTTTIVPLAVGLLALGLALAVALHAGALGQSGSRLGGSGQLIVEQTLLNFGILAMLGGIVLPVQLVGVVREALRGRPVRGWLIGAALVALIILPQVALYQGDSFVVGRYQLPAGLALTAGIAAGNTWLRERGYRVLFAICITIWAVDVAVFAMWTWRDAEALRADSAQLAQAVAAVVDTAPPGSAVAIAADPTDMDAHEPALSWTYHLAATGLSSYDMRLLVVPPRGGDAARAEESGSALARTAFRGHRQSPDADCSDLAAVILVASEAATRQALPCLSTAAFRVRSFSETVSLGALRGWPLEPLVPSRNIEYNVLLRS